MPGSTQACLLTPALGHPERRRAVSAQAHRTGATGARRNRVNATQDSPNAPARREVRGVRYVVRRRSACASRICRIALASGVAEQRIRANRPSLEQLPRRCGRHRQQRGCARELIQTSHLGTPTLRSWNSVEITHLVQSCPNSALDDSEQAVVQLVRGGDTIQRFARRATPFLAASIGSRSRLLLVPRTATWAYPLIVHRPPPLRPEMPPSVAGWQARTAASATAMRPHRPLGSLTVPPHGKDER